MKAITGYWGNYLESVDSIKARLFRATIQQINRVYPDFEVEIWYPYQDQILLWNLMDNLNVTAYCALPKNLEHPILYDQVRYAIARYQTEPYLWVDPDLLLFKPLDQLDHYDIYGYRREDRSCLYPGEEDSIIREYVQELGACRYRRSAGNLGLLKIKQPEIGYIIAEEYQKLAIKYRPEAESILHCWISQGLPILLAEKYNKSVAYLEDFSCNSAWHFCGDTLNLSETEGVMHPGRKKEETEMWYRVFEQLSNRQDINSLENFKDLIREVK